MYFYLFSLLTALCISTDWLEYENKEQNFKVSYPNSWTVVNEQGVSMFLMASKKKAGEFSEHLTIMVQDMLAQPMTLEQFTQLTLDQYNDVPKADKIWPIKDVELGGMDAKSVVLTINYMGLDLKIKQYWLVKETSAYVFTYTAYQKNYDRYVADATKLIESFQFLK